MVDPKIGEHSDFYWHHFYNVTRIEENELLQYIRIYFPGINFVLLQGLRRMKNAADVWLTLRRGKECENSSDRGFFN